MYVTAGQYKGHKIIIPSCAKPTLSKVRQGVFNVLYSDLKNFGGLIFLDLFAGSGIMSLEALSRGFRTVSVEKNLNAYRIIKKNLEIAKTGWKALNIDAIKFLKSTNIKPDVIYIDPPWDFDYMQIMHLIRKKIKNSIVIAEYDKKRAQELSAISAEIAAPFQQKVYGRCKLDFIRFYTSSSDTVAEDSAADVS